MNKAYILGLILLCIGLMYRFPHIMLNPGELVAGHQELNDKCLSCHRPFRGISNDKCIACHKLSEIGKDTVPGSDSSSASAKILFHHRLSGQECTACHTDHLGTHPETPVSNFDHALLAEPIISKCTGCHHQPTDNLHKQLPVECANCHNTGDWKPTGEFDHDMILGMNRKNCSSCHKTPDDFYHHLFKETCDKCHSTEKWIPSSFDHAAYFKLDEDHNVKCITCHTSNNFSSYTCYGCHEHTESKLMKEHNEEGIFNFTNCVSCHKSADEHDIIMDGKPRRELNQREVNDVKKYIRSKEKDKDREHNDH